MKTIKHVKVNCRDIIKLAITALEFEIKKWDAEYQEMVERNDSGHRYAKELTKRARVANAAIDDLHDIWPYMSHHDNLIVNDADAHMNHK